MQLQDILRNKGSRVHSIHPEATLDDAVQALVRNNVGSLVVCAAGSGDAAMVGILTERDILRACAAGHGNLAGQRVADVMTAEPVVGSPSDTVSDTMGLMTQRRIRHLPLVEEGKLCGLISIGDVVKAQHDQTVLENHYLKSYIQS